VLTDNGSLLGVDVDTGTETGATFALQRGPDDVASRIGISATGGEIVLVWTAPGEEQPRADILMWDRPSAAPELSVRIGGRETRPYWTGFSPDATQFGVGCSDGLRVFNRQGKEVVHLAGSGRTVSFAADLSAFAMAEYDLVQLFRRSRGRWVRHSENVSTEALVLAGAAAMVGQVCFLGHDGTVVGLDLRGRLLEWRPEAEIQRGMSMGGMEMIRSFGNANRLEPSNRLEGLPRASVVLPHPSEPDDLIVVARTGAEHWRLADPTKPIETIPVGASAHVVVDSVSGIIAAATEDGVWTRHIDAIGQPGVMVGPGGSVWDVAIGGAHIAATCPDGYVRIWRLEDAKEIERLPVEAEALSLLFSHDGIRLYIGLSNGVLWEWSASGDMRRLGALGVGPIRRLRISADGRIGAAAGKSSEDDDDPDRMHGGVAVWSPRERRLRWTTERLVISPHDVDVSADGAVLFVADTREAIAMDSQTGAVIARMRPPQADASKPDHVTAVCAGPDGRTAFLGLWDGSIVHVDILSRRVISVVKAHKKYVSSLACDHARGLLVSSSPIPKVSRLAVWRAWDPEFFRETVAHGERLAEIRRAIEIRHGTLASTVDADDPDGPLNIINATSADAVAEARAMRDYDEMRAADLLAEAATAGRVAELSVDERRLAGEVLLRTDPTRGLPLLEEAARDGSIEADLTIGVHLLGKHPGHASWERAVPNFRRAAERGHAHAAYLVGYYHDRIERGVVGAVNWRAIALPTGVTNEPDRRNEIARKWYELAARGGSSLAQSRLTELSPDTAGL
jgi:WD40 repeat protein